MVQDTTRQKIFYAAKKMLHDPNHCSLKLEDVAEAADMTRGAIYWHFKSRAGLVGALQHDFIQRIKRIEVGLPFECDGSALLVIQTMLLRIFELCNEYSYVRLLQESKKTVDQIAEQELVSQHEMKVMLFESLGKLEQLYSQAQSQGEMQIGLDYSSVACDTFAFVNGLLHLVENGSYIPDVEKRLPALICSHIALRERR